MKRSFLCLIFALCFIRCNHTENDVLTETEIPDKLEIATDDENFQAGLDSIYEAALSIATRQKLVYRHDQMAYRDNRGKDFGLLVMIQ